MTYSDVEQLRSLLRAHHYWSTEHGQVDTPYGEGRTGSAIMGSDTWSGFLERALDLVES